MRRNMKDLIIVGAGPAGLMAAKTAAQKGLSVILIERQKDITDITRTCSAQLVLDEGYEGETLKVTDDKIIFTKNQFEVPYTGARMNLVSNNMISPKGHKVHFAHPNNKPFAVKFDKGELLRSLSKACEKLGVEIRLETRAQKIEDNGNEVCVTVKCHGQEERIYGKKLIICEGANASLTEMIGLNEGRQLFGMPLVACYTFDETKDLDLQSWNQFYGNNYHPFAEVMVGSSLEGLHAMEVVVMGTKDLKPEMLLKKVIGESPLKEKLAGAKVIRKTGCAVKSYASLKRPYKGNILIIGDSAAHVETLVQGALMCGYHAADAIKKELMGQKGFEAYTTWWNKAFEFNRMDSLEFVKLYGTLSIKGRFADDEIDYLFAMLEGNTLCGNFSQFETPKTLWRELLKMKMKIQEERPEIYEKMRPIEDLAEKGLI